MARTRDVVVALGLGLIAAAGGCASELEVESEREALLGDVIPLADILAGVTGESDATASPEELAALTSHQRRGRRLFNEATFGGNGRTCRSCHPSGSGESGQLNLAEVQARFAADPDDPLFQHDGADVGSPGTFNRLLAEGTIQVTVALPANVSIVGSSARSVTVLRSVPTTMNVATLDPVLMWDGRAPTLQAQAAGAIVGHAQTSAFNQSQLDAIADFETTLFNRDALRSFAAGGPAPELPPGNTPLEIYGRTFFTPDGPNSKCGWCHTGPMLNEVSPFFEQLNATAQPHPGSSPLPAGSRFENIFLNEFNTPGNPVYTFRFTNPDGTFTDVVSPDPGLALITGYWGDSDFYKIPTVWGANDTAPYFHDNSSKTLEDLVRQYDRSFRRATNGGVSLTEVDQQAIVAYIKLL